MPTCAAACPAYSHAARVAARLNARFFNVSGVGLEQGLLIHGLDHQTSGTKKQWCRRKRPVLKARVAAGMQRLEEEVDAGGGGVELEARNGV